MPYAPLELLTTDFGAPRGGEGRRGGGRRRYGGKREKRNGGKRLTKERRTGGREDEKKTWARMDEWVDRKKVDRSR